MESALRVYLTDEFYDLQDRREGINAKGPNEAERWLIQSPCEFGVSSTHGSSTIDGSLPAETGND